MGQQYNNQNIPGKNLVMKPLLFSSIRGFRLNPYTIKPKKCLATIFVNIFL